jgi:pimeloyl-ACP methyl ester carboxylesterase
MSASILTGTRRRADHFFRLLCAVIVTVAALASFLLWPELGFAAAKTASAASAETRYVQVNGDRIAYRRIGKGSPILFANRLRGTLDTWDPMFLDALALNHTVITVDYPGIGYSGGALPADMGAVGAFLDDFAKAIALDRFAILGWSWGGLAAQALLLDRPQRVTHGILVGTNPPAPNPVPMQQVFIERAFKPVNDLADEEILFFEPRSAPSRAAALASHKRIYARDGVAEKIPSTPEAIQAYLKTAGNFHEDKAGRRKALTQTQMPLLILSGDNDPATPSQNWFPLVGQLRNAQLMFYSEAGHGPQHQYPELSAEYIVRFLARTAH